MEAGRSGPLRHDFLTEQQNPCSRSIDSLSTADLLKVINTADAQVAVAVESELPNITSAVDAIVGRLQHGGRLFYIGAGTSGRLGVLDASECVPTFQVSPELVQGIIAGGDSALRHPSERAEDDREQGKLDLLGRGFGSGDALVGIAASGRTPYVLGALELGRSLGAMTIGLSCVHGSEVAAAAQIAITPTPGPEIITGSTRMRAGTATKLVLNMLSTGAMIRLGYVYGNLMVNVAPTNTKLADRARRIIAQVAGVSYDEASRLLAESGSVRTAIVMHKCQLGRIEAENRLDEAQGRLRKALGE